MASATAAYYDVVSFDGRVVSLGVWRRVIRFIAINIMFALAAAAVVGLLIVAVTMTAAWIVNTGLSSNSHIHAKAQTGPGPLALLYDPNPTGSAGTMFETKWARTTTSTPRLLEVPHDDARREITQVTAPLHVARLDPATAPADALLNKRLLKPKLAAKPVNLVPLPRPHPALRAVQQELALAMPQAAPQAVEPKADQQVAMAPRLASPEKRVTPLPAHNKSMALPEAFRRTALYDIAGKTVYMPNGERLEAHSGLGDKRDNPRYIKVRMRGPTPPNVYDLTMREALFHGVRAIRLNPVDESKMHGRAGMLAHTYMLGANGQSNGCVSFKDYRKFLNAFLNGEVNRLVVVPELGNTNWRTAVAQHGQVRRYAANSRTGERSGGI